MSDTKISVIDVNHKNLDDQCL